MTATTPTTTKTTTKIKRGEVFFAQLNPVQGSEQGGMRPVLVVQNDVGNTYSPTTIVLAITSRTDKAHLPTHVALPSCQSGLARDSVVLAEQIRTIDKKRLGQRVTSLPPQLMHEVTRAMMVSINVNG